MKEEKEIWEEEFEIIPAVNYNLYMGSGKDVCDDCLEFEEAKEQIKSFIRQLLEKQKEKILEMIEGMEMKEKSVLSALNEAEEDDIRNWNKQVYYYNQALDDIKKLLT